MHIIPPRQFGPVPDQPLRRRHGEQQSECSSAQADQEAFSQLLPDQRQSAAAQGTANCHLSPSRRRPRYQEVGEIEAGNQKQAENRRQQHIKRSLHVTDDVFEQRFCDDALLHRSHSAKSGVEFILDAADLLKGRRWGSTRSETRHHVSDVNVVTRCRLRRYADPPWHPQLDFRIRVLKPGRQHPDYRIGLSVEVNRFAQNRGIGVEPSLEEAPSENRRCPCSDVIVV